MKQYTSKFLKSVALFYMGFPVFYVIFAALLFDIPGNACIRLLLSPFYYLVGVLAVISGYGLWEMKRWAWYLFVCTNILVAYGNALLANEYSESHHRLLAFLASLLFVLFITYQVAREVRVPYFFPKIRWWESNPRYRLSVHALITSRANGGVEGQILDLSLGGCFVKLRADLRRDDVVILAFHVFGFDIRCEGVIVWSTESTVTHPRGVGVKFASLSRTERKKLRQVCARLRKISSLYRKSRYLMNQDDFTRKLEELERVPVPSRKDTA